MSAGRCTTAQGDAAIEAIGGPESAVYGEITTIGFRTLAGRLKLGSGDTFTDLGSGLGRAVLQAVREFWHGGLYPIRYVLLYPGS